MKELITGLLTLLLLAVAVYLYFLPTSIAYRRRARSRGWILLFNIFTAGTIILWFALLFWANSAETEKRSPDR
jgi:RsiW-degrading membrane proteinase PrsW (M82 family)